ncbi:MAG: hypothetical protein ACLP1W_17700, partial [Rhodomicrobium sp.]
MAIQEFQCVALDCSDVYCQGHNACRIGPFAIGRGMVASWIVHGGRQSHSDDGDQALMRGLATAFPFIRPGLAVSS